jgi:hypothetical protein
VSGFKASSFWAPVPIGLGQIRAAWPVAASPVKAAAYTANWLLGRGTPLAVDGGHSWLPGSDSDQTRTLRYKFHLDSQHVSLGVFIVASISNPFAPVTINGTIYSIGSEATIVHFPTLNFGGDVDVEYELLIEWPAGDVSSRNWLEIHNVQIYESPVIILADTASGTVPPEPSTIVYDGYDDQQSIAGLERAVEDMRASYFRRGTLFNWVSGYADGLQASNTSYEDLTPEQDPSIQVRLMYSGETVRRVKFAACAAVSSGTGNIRATMTSGDTVTLNIVANTPVWLTGDIDIETDDPSRWATDGGIRGGTRDNLRIEYKAASGQTMNIYAISVWDPPGD